MASIVSRRLAPKLSPLNPQNPNPLPALFQAYINPRNFSQLNPPNAFTIPSNPTPLSFDPTTTTSFSRLPFQTPTTPNPSFLRSFSTSTSNLQSQSLFQQRPNIPDPSLTRRSRPFSSLNSTAPKPSQIPPNQKQHANPNPNPLKPHTNLLENPYPQKPIARSHSSSPAEEGSGAGDQSGLGAFKHQEITGPTVERDESALANETRQVIEALAKSIYDLSSALAVLGVAHLALGAWIAYAVRPPDEVFVQGLMAFAFPFSAAFLMRRSIKPITFFRKMEGQGRLQVLTLALQAFKSVNVLMLRARVVAFCCVLGISAGSLAALWQQLQTAG